MLLQQQATSGNDADDDDERYSLIEFRWQSNACNAMHSVAGTILLSCLSLFPSLLVSLATFRIPFQFALTTCIGLPSKAAARGGDREKTAAMAAYHRERERDCNCSSLSRSV